MAVTVIVGGQFGSEGKGKVAYDFAKRQKASIAIRVGGANSGHTAVDENGVTHTFRHLPTACLLPGVMSVIAAGSYVDPDVLVEEIRRTNMAPDRLIIDRNVVLISGRHKQAEIDDDLRGQIGSTGSGTGAAVVSRIRRDGFLEFADSHPVLAQFVGKVSPFLRHRLDAKERIIVEGTQGFGLSLLHSDLYPKVTSRDTTASAFISEAGLSPLDVDDVVMVLRAFPIRVAGSQSGHLPGEIDWETIQEESGYPHSIVERTTVTNFVRRVARFDAMVVRQAIEINQPTTIVLNHADYFDYVASREKRLTQKVREEIAAISVSMGGNIDWVGVSPEILISTSKIAQTI